VNQSVDPKDQKAQNLRSIVGPSFKECLPSEDEWLFFKKSVNDEKGLAILNLWYEKAKSANGIPLRKEFSFEDLVSYGSNIHIMKLNENNSWETTFCGNAIVSAAGFDATNKCLEDFACPETLKFWVDNLDIMIEKHTPFLEFYTLEFVNKDFIHCSSVNLPMKSENSDFPNSHLSYEIYTSETMLPDHLK